MIVEPAEKFLSRIIPEPNTGCWLWEGGSRGGKGYGQFNPRGKNFAAHRFSYQLHVGEIPKGLSVLHKCDTPACVNPEHLFLGTQTDNMRDRAAKKRDNGGKTHCKWGHEFNAENTYRYGTHRLCRVCRQRRYRAQKS